MALNPPQTSRGPDLIEARAVYVHVPFCRHRCGYCDFSLVAGRDDLVGRYFQALDRELDRVGAGTDQPRPRTRLRPTTLYVGGGTPSHLGAEGLRTLFAILGRRFAVAAGAEVTVEANPADVDAPVVAALLESGVTRVSLGGQSLDATTLRALDRDHTPDDVLRAVGLLRSAGLVVNVDLMVAAPGQSLEAVDRDLGAMAGLGAEHLSVYCLTWEKGTAFESQRRRGWLQPVDEPLERAMFELAIDRLGAAGFEHYEVSNFARPGFRCRHNQAYWDCQPWEAFGPGAARFDGRTRITNHRSPHAWMRLVLERGDAEGDRDAMTAEEAARERLVVGLRRRDGVERAAFEAASGFSLEDLAAEAIADWKAAGLAEEEGSRLRLTREGLLLSDSLWAAVLR